MKIRSLLNGGVAEVDDEAGKVILESGHWVVEGEAAEPKPAVRRRAPRAKVEPADPEE
jgi:hypothetical protein